MCRKDAGLPLREHFFIIDEINRGNLSKILGELMMAIEQSHRGEKITLAYQDEAGAEIEFVVPENVYIIGMMNTADRSLALIDYALRRRFSFFELEPGFESEGFRTYQEAMANATFDKLIDVVVELNKAIAADNTLGRCMRLRRKIYLRLWRLVSWWWPTWLDMILV